MADQTPQTQNQDTLPGFLFALSAYVMWGFLPLYLKLVSHIPPTEVVAHRVIWAVPIAFVVLLLLRRTRDLVTALRTPRMLAMGFVTAALISINWSIYVWSVSEGQAVNAALGYYINPLFSIALGWLLLGETPSRPQMVAVALAAIAVIVLGVSAGGLPWAAVGLTLSWGFYAFFKKWLPIGPNQGFLLEVLILCPFAIVYLLFLGITAQGYFGVTQFDTLLLLAAGAVTAFPLLAFGNGAKRLRLSTAGILGYIAPTMIFLIAVFVFKEPFDQARMIAFPLIWLALIIYTVEMFRKQNR